MNSRILAIAIAASVVSTSLSTGAFAQDKVRWRVPIAFGTNLPALGDNVIYIADMLKVATDGRIQFKLSEPNDIVPPFGITDAVRENKIPAGYTWLGYDQGKIPVSALFAAVPFGLEPIEYTAWWYEAGGQQLAEEIYAKRGIHPVFCGIIGPETAGWFRSEITSLEDIRGLKIRFAGLGGKVMQKLGASVTLLPGGEIFQALEKGSIDATEFSMPAIDQRLGFDKLVKFNYFPGWHQTYTAFHFVVNKEEWDGLGEADRALIDVTCTAGVTRNLAHGEAIQGEVLQEFEQQGVTSGRLPESILRELQAVTAEVLAEEAAKDEEFKMVLESQQAFLESYKNWKTLAYLPRDF